MGLTVKQRANAEATKVKSDFIQNTKVANGSSRNDHHPRTVSADEADMESSFDPIRDDFMTIRVPRKRPISDNFKTDQNTPEVLKTYAAPLENADSEVEAAIKSSHALYLKIRMQKQMKKRMHDWLHDFSVFAADQ